MLGETRATDARYSIVHDGGATKIAYLHADHFGTPQVMTASAESFGLVS